MTAYHRLARTDAYRWWRPLIEIVVFVGLVIGSWLVVLPVLDELLGPEVDNAPGIVKLGATLAVLTPAALLAARIMGRAPGTLSSIALALRWRWLARCLAISLAFVVANVGLQVVLTELGAPLGGAPSRGFPGWGTFLPLLAAVLAVIPLQAAAEEYAFRGTLLQAIGAWIAPPWVAITLTAVIFGLAHGLGPEGFVAITVFGAVAAYVTVTTGGLEAAIALHVVNNVSSFVMIAATGGAGSWVSTLNDDVSWLGTTFDVVVNVLYAVMIRRVYARRASR